MIKICPICESLMNYYEEGVHDTKEYGFCCPTCEIGFYSYKKKKVLKDIKIFTHEKIKSTCCDDCRVCDKLNCPIWIGKTEATHSSSYETTQSEIASSKSDKSDFS